jgi:antitoxin component of MazEF toxin-antitoxin module
MTLPKAYVDQNNLTSGSVLSLEIVGKEITAKPRIKRTLDEILAATPREGLHVEGWDDMKPMGREWPNEGWDQ